MNVLLLGASGRIGQRIANELLERDHDVTGVSRSGEIDAIDDPDFKAVAGDATNSAEIAELAEGHDAVASALGPSGDEGVEIVPEMAEALIEGLRQTDVDRFVWTGGAGGLNVGPDTQLVETDEFPDELVPLAEAHIDAWEVIRDVDDLQWSYIAPPAQIERGSGRASTERRTDDSSPARTEKVTFRWKISLSPSLTNSKTATRFTHSSPSATKSGKTTRSIL